MLISGVGHVVVSHFVNHHCLIPYIVIKMILINLHIPGIAIQILETTTNDIAFSAAIFDSPNLLPLAS
jgi:hypothetical protein